MTDLAGLSLWQLTFDKDGHADEAAREALLAEISGAGVTDLVVMSHGWNNATSTAEALYRKWFAMLPPLVPGDYEGKLGTLGIIWPSMLWADEVPPDSATGDGGGAAGLADAPAPADDGATVTALTAVYHEPAQQELLARLGSLLTEQPEDPAKLDEFQDLMKQLAATEPEDPDAQDDAVGAMLGEDARSLAMRFADGLQRAQAEAATPGGGSDMGGAADLNDAGALVTDDGGAAAGLGSITKSLWHGAKEALRQTTYWMMKHRAGTVGQKGLAPFLAALVERAPNIRVHLVGHSFGARLVSFTLAGLPDGQQVSSLTLLQGAFSHWSFTDSLPFAPGRNGALSGMMARVSGPLVACFSSHDMAVGILYPLASMTAHEDASALDDQRSRWAGMGSDGAQGVEAAGTTLDERPAYALAAGGFTNVDCSSIVCHGGPPSGAHSDIIHPELARVVLSAAGILR